LPQFADLFFELIDLGRRDSAAAGTP